MNCFKRLVSLTWFPPFVQRFFLAKSVPFLPDFVEFFRVFKRITLSCFCIFSKSLKGSLLLTRVSTQAATLVCLPKVLRASPRPASCNSFQMLLIFLTCQEEETRIGSLFKKQKSLERELFKATRDFKRASDWNESFALSNQSQIESNSSKLCKCPKKDKAGDTARKKQLQLSKEFEKGLPFSRTTSWQSHLESRTSFQSPKSGHFSRRFEESYTVAAEDVEALESLESLSLSLESLSLDIFPTTPFPVLRLVSHTYSNLS